MLKHPLVLVSVLSFASVSSVSSQQRTPTRQPQRATTIAKELTASELFAKNRKAVVIVETPTGFGSGVIVDSSGLIVTNLHVIADDSQAKITLADGDIYDDIMVAAVDSRRDLALLRIAGFGLTAVDLGNSDTSQVGDKVYALGTPQGLELSLSDGILSALRDNEVGGYKVLQTTAAISPGSSGGGLFNQRGELIGITSFKIRGGENLNFAVPVNYVRGLIGTASATISLTEVHAKYGTAKENQPKPPNLATTTAPIPSVVIASKAPRLSISYRSARYGGSMLVSQRDETATITIYNSSFAIVGHALVNWDERLERFTGKADVAYVCGPIDTRTTVVTSEIQYYAEAGGVLREVYQHPTGLNCSKNQVKGWASGEDRWWPAP